MVPGGCERRRRPCPSRSGAELLGRYSEGTSSPGRSINGEDIVIHAIRRGQWDTSDRRRIIEGPVFEKAKKAAYQISRDTG